MKKRAMGVYRFLMDPFRNYRNGLERAMFGLFERREEHLKNQVSDQVQTLLSHVLDELFRIADALDFNFDDAVREARTHEFYRKRRFKDVG